MELIALRLRGDSVSSTNSDYSKTEQQDTSRFKQVFKLYCSTHRKSIDMFLFSLLICLGTIAICFLCIPTVTYIRYKVITVNSQQQSPVHTNTNNTINNQSNNNSNTCSHYGPRNESSCTNDMSWSHLPSNNNNTNNDCQIASTSAFDNTLTTCLPFLTAWHTCTIGTTDTMYVSKRTALPSISRNQISQLLAYKSVASQSCQSVLLPFICQLSFPLCSCTNGDLYLPSRETCLTISTDTCKNEWLTVSSINPLLLPDCQLLLHEDKTNFNQTTMPSNSTTNNNNDSLITSTEHNDTNVCSEHFYKLNNTCLPDCTTYGSDRHILIGALTAATIILIGSFGVFIIGLLQWKQMFKLPAVILLYTTFSCLLFGLVNVFSQVDSTLFCTSRNLIESLSNPSVFCKVSGFIVTYCLVSIFCWSFALFVFIFYKLTLKGKGKCGPKLDKYLHFVFFVLCQIYPLLVGVLPILVTDWEYTMITYPPTHCNTKSIDYWYYTIILPISITMGITVCLSLALIWRWVRRRWTAVSSKEINLEVETNNDSKFILYYCCIVILELILLLQSILFTTTSTDTPYMEESVNYFVCELFGHDVNSTSQCHLPDNKGYTYPLIFYYILLGFVPLCIIAVLVQWKVLGTKLKGIFKGFNKK